MCACACLSVCVCVCVRGFLGGDYYHYRDAAKTADNEYAFLNANLSYQKKDSKWEYNIQVTNALNTDALNQDGFNDLFISSSAYMVQPRYVVFKLKYDL